jgi:hypothetical protein
MNDDSDAKPQVAGVNVAAQAAETPNSARARLAATAAQVHRDLFGAADAGEGDGVREEAGVVPVG